MRTLQEDTASDSVIVLWTDGACTNKGQHIGGWAFVAERAHDGVVLLEACSPVRGTTANRMELTAAIEALRWAKREYPGRRFEVRSDSRYVVSGAERKMFYWARNDWRYPRRPYSIRAGIVGAEVANADLWRQLDQVLGDDVRPGFFYVPGHTGIEHNERADVLSKEASRQLTTKRQPSPRRI